ncbi:MAG: hypothetical protein P8Y66_09835 [Nitrospirota bacterium]|jgi:hypothetical protein
MSPPSDEPLHALCAKHGELLHEFDRRSIRLLRRRHPKMAAAMPFFSDFRDANVQKEIEKDCLAIRQAVNDFGNEADPDDVFKMTKDVDRNFLRRISRLPVKVNVDYDAIKPVRMARIGLLTEAVQTLLSRLHSSSSLAEAARRAYSPEEVRELIRRFLSLYIRETELLERETKLPPLIGRAATALSDALIQAMKEASRGLAEDCIEKLFGEEANRGPR